MADPTTLLQALQSSYYKPSETSAGITSQVLASSIPALYNPYASSGSNFGVTLGAGLLSGLLGGYARSVAQEDNAAMTPLIGQILQAPASERSALAAGNERLSPLVAALQFNDMERSNKLQDAIQGKGIDLAYDPLIEQRKAQMMEPLELQKASKLKLQDAAAEQGIYTIGDQQLTAEEVGILDPIQLAAKKEKELEIAKDNALRGTDSPNAPDYKLLQDKIATERALANDFKARAESFKYKEQGLKALEQAYYDTEGTSDFELIRRSAQFVEPGLAVRADDQESLKQAAGVLNIPYQTIVSAAGGTKLTDEVRAGMLRIAQRSYDSEIQDYNTIRQSFLTRAKEAKLNESAVVPFEAGKPFAELYPDLNSAIGLPAAGNLIKAPDGQLIELVD